MRGLRTAISAAAIAATFALAAPAGAATTLNVTWNDSCGKATCFDENGTYRQSWASADFTGPVSIGDLIVQRGVLGALDGKTFRISFSLNGEELGTWGRFTMGGIAGDELTFDGFDFTWIPEMGDLVLTLEIDKPPPSFGGGGGGGGFFAFGPPENPPPGAPGNPPPETGDGPLQPSDIGGPVREVGPIPEPATWAMMIIGFGAAGATLRRRRTLTA